MATNSKKKPGGSTEDARAQAAQAPPPEQKAAGRYEAGEYVLLVDKYTPSGAADPETDLVKGDLVHLDSESVATRLVRAGAVATPDTQEAKRAQAKGDPVQEKRVRAEELEREAARLRNESQNPSQRAEADEE